MECHGDIFSERDYCAIFNVARSTLHDHMQNELGDFTLGTHSNRRREQTAADEARQAARLKAIEEILEANKRFSLRDVQEKLAAEGHDVPSRSTIWEDLTDAGWRAKARKVVPYSGDGRKEWMERRLDFARAFLDKKEWKPCQLLFSDESIFRCTDDRKVQWCRVQDLPEPREVHKWSASCHVWACIGFGFRFITLINGVGTGPRGGVTSEDFVNFLKGKFEAKLKRHLARHPGKKFLWVQDGARIHTTDEALAYIRSLGLSAMDKKEWPPHSPDLNPIENLWGIGKHAVEKQTWWDLSASKANVVKLAGAIDEFWRSHDEQHINKLVASFFSRLRSVVNRKGAETDY
jgi:transposase